MKSYFYKKRVPPPARQKCHTRGGTRQKLAATRFDTLFVGELARLTTLLIKRRALFRDRQPLPVETRAGAAIIAVAGVGVLDEVEDIQKPVQKPDTSKSLDDGNDEHQGEKNTLQEDADA